MMTRLEFLRWSARASAVCAGASVLPVSAWWQEAAANDDRRQRIERIVREFDEQGIHRTATTVDARSGDWLVERAKAAGAGVEKQAFTLDRVDVRSAYVEAGGRRIEALPLFDGAFTGAAGFQGRIGPAASDADVGLTDVDAAGISSEGRSLGSLRRSASHRALIAVTRGASPGLTPMNAGDFTAPYGVPVLQVASEEGSYLRELAAKRAGVTVVAHAERTRASADNVVATVRGTQPSLPAVVVITPRSGWWQCAAERGGGLACWLEAMRAVGAARLARTVVFLASSGHELGHLGLGAFLGNRREPVDANKAWLHLGANIGAAGGRARLQASDDGIEKMAGEALMRAGTPVEQRVPRGTVPAGEARNIHLGGGRYVSLLGTSPVFHSRADRWPKAVDAAALTRYAAAVSDLVMALAGPE
jgi:hypothetical protein